MRHCLNSAGISLSGGQKKVSSDVQLVPTGIEGRIQDWATEQILEKSHFSKALSVHKTHEIGRLSLDPSPPFMQLKIRGIVHPLSGNGLKENSKRVFEGSFLHIPVLPLSSPTSKPKLSPVWCNPIWALLLALLFPLHSLFSLHLPPASDTEIQITQQDEAVFLSKYHGTKWYGEKQLPLSNIFLS